MDFDEKPRAGPGRNPRARTVDKASDHASTNIQGAERFIRKYSRSLVGFRVHADGCDVPWVSEKQERP